MADPTLKYRKLAYHDARDVGLDPLAFIRQIRQESGFNTGETSSAGAQGIAQIMPGTAQSWGVDPNDPVAALRAAAKHMAGYVKQYGSLRNALVAYNAGPGAVGGNLPAETQHYIDVILGGQGQGQTKLFDVPAGGPSTPPASSPTVTPPTQTPSPTTPATPVAQAPAADQTIPKLLAVFGAMNQANANQPWLGPPQNAPQSNGQSANPYSAILAAGTPNVAQASPIPSVAPTAPVTPVTPTAPNVPPTHVHLSSPGTYVNPFGKSLVAPGRIDEGTDPTIKGAIGAVGNAKIINISSNFYKGEPYIVYQLLDGIHKGRYIYVSELVTPTVKEGQTVKAGQTIATGHGAIETGWAGGPQGGYMPLANKAQGGNYTEGLITTPGQSFAKFMRRLGARTDR